MEIVRYSARQLSWWDGDTVEIVEDRKLHKYAVWVKKLNRWSKWLESPDAALKDYNATYPLPHWEVNTAIWPDWYGPVNK